MTEEIEQLLKKHVGDVIRLVFETPQGERDCVAELLEVTPNVIRMQGVINEKVINRRTSRLTYFEVFPKPARRG